MAEPADPTALYAQAYWGWLRGETMLEPLPTDHEVDHAVAAAIRRQCELEFQRTQPVAP